MARLILGGGRYSLRARMFIVLFVTGLAPQVAVFALSTLERPVIGRMQRATEAAMNEARGVAQDANAHDELREIAQKHRVRLRLYGNDNQQLWDFDFDEEPYDPVRSLERYVVATATPAEVRGVENWRGPPPSRQEYLVGRSRGTYADFDLDTFVFCQGIATIVPQRPFVVHVQKSSYRAVGPVYALRRRMLRLALFTVPLSILVAYFLARRLQKPLEKLRDATLQKAAAAHAVADLPEGADEVGQVGQSVNVLLRALDERRKATSAFMADAVHEVKNPVAAIKAAAESLATGEASPERQQKIARIVADSAVKLDRLVTELLDLSRAEAGMPGEERAPIDIAELARAVGEGVSRDVRFAGVTFEVNVDEDLRTADPPKVNGVSSRLESALRELVVNGASFCKDGGGTVRMDIRADTRDVTLDITDTGPGIEPQALSHIFDRFFTTRGEQKGTGLGLAMVKAVIEAHDGSVTATSTAGKGACFSVRLPRAPV